jgi:hypothetical protein
VTGTGLLTYLDQMKRQLFLENWDKVVSAKRDAARQFPHE